MIEPGIKQEHGFAYRTPFAKQISDKTLSGIGVDFYPVCFFSCGPTCHWRYRELV
jgi:hypothetical protein